MKTFKKVIALVLAMTVVVSMSAMGVSAATADQTSTEALTTEFTFEFKNDPTYTVTIPSSVVIAKTGTQMDIVAEDVADLDNQKVSVTIAGTDQYRNQMVLQGNTTSGPRTSIRYQLVKNDGTVIETTGGKDEVVGVELASFTEDGTVSLTVLPVLNDPDLTAGVTYTGGMTYGIELVTVE